MSVDIDGVRALVDRLASQGVEYAVGLYPFIYSSEEFRHRNVTATLESAFGSDVAKRVYSELENVFKGVDIYARVKIEGWEGSLKDYLRRHLFKEHVTKPILEESERRLSRIPEEDRRALSVACAIIRAVENKGYPVLWASSSDWLGFPSVSSTDKEYFSMVVSSVLGSKTINVRSLFYKYLLGF